MDGLDPYRGSVTARLESWPPSVDVLTRHAELGDTWGFNQVRPQMEELFAQVEVIRGFDLSQLSLSSLQTVSDRLNEASELFDSLIAFRTAQGTQERSALILRVERLHREITRELRPIITETQLGTTDLGPLRSEATTLIADLRTASGSHAVSAHAEAFKSERRSNQVQAAVWLVASIAVAVAVAVTAFRYHFPTQSTKPTLALAFESYGPHLVAATLGVSFLVVFIRLFRENLSRAAINGHRVRALETFQTFINASAPGPIRDAVMLETTRAIFAHVEDGSTRESAPSGLLGLLSGLARKGESP